MRLLFIHEVNYETKVIFEIQEFPELLALRGHQIDFLHFPEKVGILKSSLRTKVKKISGRVYPEAKINLITPPNFGGSFMDRLISTITLIPLLWKLVSKSKYDAIILYAVPTSGWQTALIAKFKGVPVVFRALDVSHLLRHGITEKLVKMAEKTVYQNVSLISANNQALGLYCQQISGNSTVFNVDLPPLDFSHFQTETLASTNWRKILGISQSDFVLLFMGTFYEFSGIPKVIKSLSENPDKNLIIVLVGGGKQESEIRKLVSELGLEGRVVLTGVISYQQLPEILKAADVAFNSFEPILISNVAFPHKVLQYLASGIPTVSTKLDGLYSVLADSAGVYWIDRPEQLVQTAIELQGTSKVDLTQKVEKGKKFIASNFDINKTVINFENTIKQSIEITSHE